MKEEIGSSMSRAVKKYRKKPVVIEATQWFENGDHPKDNCQTYNIGDGPFQGEGEIVRRFRRPDKDGLNVCDKCSYNFDSHGWIDTLEGGHTVCPGDWIITGIQGEFYPCKPGIFKKTYEKVEES